MFAVVPAAGLGTRMGQISSSLKLRSKVLHTFSNGFSILELTLKAIEEAGVCMGVIVGGKEEDLPAIEEVLKKFSFPFKQTVVGGETRQETVRKCLEQIAGHARYVMVHDGARPFCEVADIVSVARAGIESDAAILAARSISTLKVVEGDFINKTVSRDYVWEALTPQVFSYELLVKAHECAVADGFTGTDDSELVERIGAEVRIVEGSRRNIKITKPEDLILAEAILRAGNE